MRKRGLTFVLLIGILCTVLFPGTAYAADVPKEETPNYKVAFYAFDCYHMQDENGKRTGYGYEMMQNISKYMQCTFSYVGYDKSATECVDMLRNGDLDIYTAAKITPEREEEFAISEHPAITATTSMNVKVGNKNVVAGDYSTYNGLKIGLLARHTYNDKVLAWIKDKGIDCEIVYYDTPTELSNALIQDDVDALVNSYIRTPEDERVLEDFGQTPYYIMARKEDQKLIDQIDAAIDNMNVETPNWRTELYNKYYGSQEMNTELTDDEKNLLKELQENGTVIRAVMNPDRGPYSWYEDDEAYGISADIFKATAEELGLKYEIIPVKSRDEYWNALESGEADIWMDQDGEYEKNTNYKATNPYLNTTLSVLQNRDSSGKIQKIAVIDDNITIRDVITANWPEAEVVVLKDTEQCIHSLANGETDGALLMTYTAQKLATDDTQNRFRVNIVPGASLDITMGVNAEDDRDFYGLWEKTLTNVSNRVCAEVVQTHVEDTNTPTFVSYLFNHPKSMILVISLVLLVAFLMILYMQSVRSKKKKEVILKELEAALKDAEKANEAKQEFFSKMSHDIRTPLNVVLGMTQIAQKYKYDIDRLEEALDSITSEGNYLLVLVNSILDVNQLEHGHVELSEEPFNPAVCVKKSAEILLPLAEKKEQNLVVHCETMDCVLVGDFNRFSQIMINIISNAVKYTNNGGRIEITMECLPGRRCRFTCTDNGIGMSEEFVSHITEDYVRAEDSRVSKTQGTGLGMSVVKGFVDLMGGTLQIRSKLGVGSSFVVEIPFKEATEEQREAVLAPVEEEDELVKFSNKKVLLAEDNELNAEIAIELLQSIGLVVDWAENGKIAVDKFNASEINEYYAVFMDMQMPVMGGIEATRLIRHSEREDHIIPIFAMTANTFASDKKRCKEAGMDGHIAKPINIEEITTNLLEKA